jgi:nitroreductase
LAWTSFGVLSYAWFNSLDLHGGPTVKEAAWSLRIDGRFTLTSGTVYGVYNSFKGHDMSFGSDALRDWCRVLSQRTGGCPLYVPTPNETVAGIVAHKSVRRFTKEPLGKGVIELLVLAAQSASTSGNMQSWSVVSVSEPESKRMFMNAGYNNLAIEQAPVYLVWLVDFTHIADQLVASGANLESLQYMETFLMGAVDVSMAAQNFVVAAESMGLGTVIHGSIRYTPGIAELALDLPDYVFPLFSMAVGWPSTERTAHQPDEIKPRMPQQHVLHHNKYNPRAPEVWGLYDHTVDVFHRTHSNDATVYPKLKLWSASNLARVTTGLNKRLVDFLAACGFGVR